jgi:hypothetical protein
MISGAGTGAAGIAYVSLTANPGAVAAIPAILYVLPCTQQWVEQCSSADVFQKGKTAACCKF